LIFERELLISLLIGNCAQRRLNRRKVDALLAQRCHEADTVTGAALEGGIVDDRTKLRHAAPITAANKGMIMPKQTNMFSLSSRRQLLRSALASTGLGLVIRYPAFSQGAAPTPQCHDGDEVTIRQTEGPYFKPSSPQRAELVEPATKGRLVEINGQVLTRSCHPVERALVDLWHADERGEYDTAGYRYRGHLFTDREGRYRFRTILPALYPGRTRHYHVKVQAPERPVLTTQLYFPDEPANRRDGLFRRELMMQVAEAAEGLAAHFDFIV